ncbi:DUF3592 domain-containing protein [Streptomyces sp. NPDC060077]|uniref:DUF3592 domain-containing protein n=1 Tax=Streptomyces sp. NPDC060077 TaxID=3347052 RepID=UPI00364CB838
MGKKKRKRSRDDWQPPPKSAEQQSLDEEVQRFRAAWHQPPVPQRRLILAVFVAALATCVAFLVFLLPAQSLVNDLRSRGVTTTAEVTASPKNKYGEAGNITVRFSGPGGEVETVLADWGGKRPEGLLAGGRVSVTYDPSEPTRVLTTEWVESPPAMTLPMLVTLILTPLFAVGAILLSIRRRKLLRAREQTAAA